MASTTMLTQQVSTDVVPARRREVPWSRRVVIGGLVCWGAWVLLFRGRYQWRVLAVFLLAVPLYQLIFPRFATAHDGAIGFQIDPIVARRVLADPLDARGRVLLGNYAAAINGAAYDAYRVVEAGRAFEVRGSQNYYFTRQRFRANETVTVSVAFAHCSLGLMFGPSRDCTWFSPTNPDGKRLGLSLLIGHDRGKHLWIRTRMFEEQLAYFPLSTTLEPGDDNRVTVFTCSLARLSRRTLFQVVVNDRVEFLVKPGVNSHLLSVLASEFRSGRFHFGIYCWDTSEHGGRILDISVA